jgi:hypothetical protein
MMGAVLVINDGDRLASGEVAAANNRMASWHSFSALNLLTKPFFWSAS